jgi:hypothetical protein
VKFELPFRMHKKNLTLGGNSSFACLTAAAFSLFSASSSSAAIINLTAASTTFATTAPVGTQTVPLSTYQGVDNLPHFGAVVNGALLLPSDAGSGSGSYRSLYRLTQGGGGDGNFDGYNRALPNNTPIFDSKVPSGFDPVITIADLIDNKGYFQFSFDINEPGSSPNSFISIDEFQVYVGSATDPAPLPSTLAGLATLGTKIWDLQSNNTTGSRMQILAEGVGSGVDNASFLIPKSLFSGFATNSLVYIYSKVGGLGAISTAPGYVSNDTGRTWSGFAEDGGGFEEWATPNAGFTAGTFVTPGVPEVDSLLPLAIMLSGATLTVRFRPRRQRLDLAPCE